MIKDKYSCDGQIELTDYLRQLENDKAQQLDINEDDKTESAAVNNTVEDAAVVDAQWVFAWYFYDEKYIHCTNCKGYQHIDERILKICPDCGARMTDAVD